MTMTLKIISSLCVIICPSSLHIREKLLTLVFCFRFSFHSDAMVDRNSMRGIGPIHFYQIWKMNCVGRACQCELCVETFACEMLTNVAGKGAGY